MGNIRRHLLAGADFSRLTVGVDVMIEPAPGVRLYACLDDFHLRVRAYRRCPDQTSI